MTRNFSSEEARQREVERLRRRRCEERVLMREASAGKDAAGLDKDRIPIEHIRARRLWHDVPDQRSLTGQILGDPIPERSALAARRAQ